MSQFDDDDDDDTEDALICEGMTEAAQAVAKFLGGLRKSSEVDGDVTLVLSQTGQGQKEVVHEMPLDFRVDVEELVSEIIDRASDDCLGLRAKKMKYTLTARDDDDAPLKGRATFTLKCPEQEDGDDIEDIEDLPNRKGLMGMLMRHQQTIMKMAVGGTKQTQEYLMRTIHEKDARIRTLESGQTEGMKAFEELISGRHVRDMELRRMENAERRKDQVAGVLMQSVPLLATKFLENGGGMTGGGQAPGPTASGGTPGGGAPGGARTPLEARLEVLLSSMSGEQFQKLMELGILDPNQQMALVEIVRIVMERQEREKQAQNGHAQPTQSSENAGDKTSSA